MLINLSNMSSNYWSVAQRTAAVLLGFGTPQDVDGGMVPLDPSMSTREIDAVAATLVFRAMKADPKAVVVSVTQDLTLNHALVTRFQARGIPIFYPVFVTQEVICTRDCGEKMEMEVFVRWREYSKTGGFEWVKEMVDLEAERGEFPPGGAAGGVIAKARREAGEG